MGSPFIAIPATTATEQERLEWLEKVRKQSPAEIEKNLYKVEEIYSSLPDTGIGAVSECATRTAIGKILDEHAHCSVPCEICNKPHCLPRDSAAKADLEELNESLKGARPWNKDSDPHLKIVDLDGKEIVDKGKKAALNTVLSNLGGGAMIGALRCVDGTGKTVILYGATGSMPKGLKDEQRVATPDGKPLSPGINAQGNFNVSSGEAVPLSAFRGIGNPAGACAAQRMLQEALALGLKPVGLAEMWFGSDKQGGQMDRLGDHLYTSCPTCKSVLAVVLCPARGKDGKQETNG